MIRRLRTTVPAAAVAGALLLPGAGPVGVDPAAAQATHLVVVVGLEGTPEHGEAFHGWATEILDAATGPLGIPAERATLLGPRPEDFPGRVDARSSREELEAALRGVGEAAGPEDRVLLILLGHGTSRDGDGLFNLPGPDVSGTDVAALLDAAFPTQTVGVVNTAPASGPFIQALSGPRRVVLTATRTAAERNETRFGEHFAEALAGGGADLDRDGRLSLLEAFTWARSEVARHYEEQNLLLTEHALLDDDGDGSGTDAPGPDTADGDLAGSFWLGGGTPARTAETPEIPADASPELRALMERRAGLQEEVDALRARRGEMETAEYERRLEELLVELALVAREIREAGGDGGGGGP